MLDLPKDEPLVLFQKSHRFCASGRLTFWRHAEAVVINKIARELEHTLKEIFRFSLYAVDKKITAADSF